MKTKAILFKTALSAIAKASAAFIAFFMTLAVTRNLSPEQSGLFLLAIAGLSAAAVFFRLGLDNVVLRKISASSGNDNSQSALTTGLKWVLLASLPTAALISLFANPIASQLLSKPDFTPVLQIAIWALPAMAVFMLIAMGFQAFHRVIATTIFQNLGISSVFLVGFAALWYFRPSMLSAVSAATIYVASAALMLLAALLLWHRQIKGDWGKPRFKDPELWQASSNLWAATSMSLAVQWAGILIAGAYVTASDIAYLSAAQRTAALTSFVLMVVNMVVAPRYARLWHEGKNAEMQRLAKWSTRGMLAMVVPVVGIMLLYPEFIMSLFGEGYQQGAILLSVMAIGQFINVATGSVGYLLNMSGHERDFRRVTFFAGPLTIVLSFVLIQQYGVLGAAIATAVGLSVQNLGALYMVRKRLGFWPLG